MDLLKDKTVLITGASRGIGNGIARLFSQNGANIAFTYRSSAEQANSLELDLMKSGSKAKGYSSDASCFDSAQQLIEKVLIDFENIDVLINNAGITKDGLLMRMSEQDFDKVMEVNMKSIFIRINIFDNMFFIRIIGKKDRNIKYFF